MRLLVLISLLLAAPSADAAARPSAGEYLAMPVAQWLQLPYRKQIGSARAIAGENRLEMCRKRISEVVDCMRETGPAPAWKDATVKSLFTECSDEMEDAPDRCPSPPTPHASPPPAEREDQP
jgi:hypothetical protein